MATFEFWNFPPWYLANRRRAVSAKTTRKPLKLSRCWTELYWKLSTFRTIFSAGRRLCSGSWDICISSVKFSWSAENIRISVLLTLREIRSIYWICQRDDLTRNFRKNPDKNSSKIIRGSVVIVALGLNKEFNSHYRGPRSYQRITSFWGDSLFE